MAIKYRQIAEKVFGRKLRSEEIVHHKDGNQHNNDPGNLQILPRARHSTRYLGQKGVFETRINELLTPEVSDVVNALDLFFTARQKEILLRKLLGLALSKTEIEYYSRKIKPKLKALANPKLNIIVWEVLLA